MNWRLCTRAAIGMAPVAAAVVLFATSNPLSVRIRDRCDPATFNAAVGAGTCVGDGTITFAHFIAELQEDQKVGAWHFSPENGTLEPGTVLSLESRGGETHTFTKVAEFGGGFVAPLNALSGNPVPAPECAQVQTDGSLKPQPESTSNIFVTAGETEKGPTAGDTVMPSGTVTKFQCCIHPWMRTELRTK